VAVISSKTAEHYQWGNQCDGWHLVKSANLSVIQERVPSGCSETLHYHHKAEQFFFVLSGIATMELEGKILSIEPNGGVHVPAGAKHRLSNQHDAELIFTVTSTPPSHGDRIEV
jgi:mannose-6-phosphate isomerase-like protein (cupin superfamily)